MAYIQLIKKKLLNILYDKQLWLKLQFVKY